jgi:SAM-dependent methyltransferase
VSEYSISPVDAATYERLDHLASVQDSRTQSLLVGLGVGPGWRCVEVGAATGSVAVWLADRVRPGGYILATDIDTRWLDRVGRDDIQVRRHDIGSEDLDDASSFDLVHTRSVLAHVPNWRDALGRMVDALRPGGWLCVEEPDWLTRGLSEPPTPGIESFWSALGGLMVSAGGDPFVGRKISQELHELGLTDIDGELHAFVQRSHLRKQLDLIAPMLTQAGILSAGDADLARVESAAPGFSYFPALVATWARKSEA